MPKTILGFVGKTGAGKGDTVEIFKKKLADKNPLVLRFSSVLCDILNMVSDGVKKEDQQWLASSLRERFGEDVLARATEKRMKNAKENIIFVDGVRVAEDEEMIKNNGGIIIFVSVPQKLRWERVTKRGDRKDDNVSFEKFQEMDKALSERQIEEIGSRADLTIDNSGDFNNLEKQIENIINQLKIQ